MRAPWSQQEWQRALVYGLGLSGLAAARLLRSQGVEVVGVDRREAGELDLGELAADRGVELLMGREPDELPVGLDGVVVSPGVPADRPLLAAARRAGIPVIAEVELGYAFVNGPVIGITGSNGKSTTTALTGALLEASGLAVEVCGNIGRPLSACTEGEAGRLFVTELSSFQLEAIDGFHPRAAALLNISADHLDRHDDLDSYLSAKKRLFANQTEEDIAVINADDPLVAEVAVSSRRRFFSRLRAVEDGCFLDGDRVVEATPGRPESELFRRQDLSLPGTHNLENAMAAVLLARAFDADPAIIPPTLGSFSGLPHRLELVRELGEVLWYDDSKGTNVGATLKSLEGFADGSVHLILGGRDKGSDFSVLAPVVERKAVRVYLIGEAAQSVGTALADRVACERSDDLATAVTSAASRVGRGEVVLLSPACASFDQYLDFHARGEHFKDLVRALDG
ncbi:MAG: UDP-N-acetylmuramoyl-L-alanine--D-glutamate ligase [Acidobacteria bacterium]|nr:MAG: UDP-N-acetylmuramoyl-L-alanine--D-glutamate ligase [Acidobacteriota bacterium]